MKLLIRPCSPLAAIWILTILAGCGGDPRPTTTADRPPAGQTAGSKLFGATLQTMNNPFFIDLEEGLKSAVERTATGW